MLSLRLNRGLDIQEVSRRYPGEDGERLLQRAEPYLKQGYMSFSQGRLAFTPQGFLVSNHILAALLL